jgi:hypothetical protein
MEEAREGKFLGHGIAANNMPGLKHEARVACLAQVSGGNQAIMTSASYHNVKLFSHL